ncbi:SIS domain-containing protein [Schleiferilactobacillus perolens]|uniref:Tagatose-6-phosphate ketose aldose isomerase n=1 Tax=Schleiferilactobacillus perolens DSM 12744 TaxID=1423792 RepID=A0A0R1N5K0_9LACO|nr:SIS domain-containing protein [Schleiferilactobacillus perolens]KRL12850.1 tagatose-6-phosphate ketose aldose isomerase [Schleiferilactobacillus perolens DSM 12744]
MFEKSAAELTKLGAEITTREIKQQPELWREAWTNYERQQPEIEAFLKKVSESVTGPVRVIFTGAGTSAYVGDTITPYLNRQGDRHQFYFEALPTTSLVSSPADYFEPDTPTLLVSFARSGNSPESVKTVELAEQLVHQLYQLTITCAPEGHLAKRAEDEDNNLVLLQPARSNDQGFAMTGSFSCMTLTALLVFDTASHADKAQWIDDIVAMGDDVIAREDTLQSYIADDFDRITYLGSGSLDGLTREAQLKILELTAGQVATVFDTSMGFRHGPKSFVNDKTLVFDFISNDAYTRDYDIDVLAEIDGDHIAQRVVAIGQDAGRHFAGDNFLFNRNDVSLPEAYLALPDVMVAQTLALLTSVKIGNKPDTPSPTGTVNRVVKGVILHDYEA